MKKSHKKSQRTNYKIFHTIAILICLFILLFISCFSLYKLSSEITFDEIKDHSAAFLAFSIILIYIIYTYVNEHFKSDLNHTSSNIRKRLIASTIRNNGINEALHIAANASKSRSVFFVDTENEDYNYITPKLKAEDHLTIDERRYFIDTIIDFSKNRVQSNSSAFLVNSIKTNKGLKRDNHKLYELFKSHRIKKIIYIIIIDKKNHLGILGTINSKRSIFTRKLLREIYVCFTMAIRNKRVLHKATYLAFTDSLTGLNNRMAYNRDYKLLSAEHSDNLCCVYIDVNELHMYNNKYGHNAGDKMLICIANILSEVFSEGRVYRMGGDEFLIFAEHIPKETLLKKLEAVSAKTNENDYHISIGHDYIINGGTIANMVKNAEKHMYEAKSNYYQNKQAKNVLDLTNNSISYIKTGVSDLDAALAVMSTRYLAVYCVSLSEDTARRILMPSYFKRFIDESHSFKETTLNYIYNMVSPDFHRKLLSFIDYDILKHQLDSGVIPKITYSRVVGDTVKLTIYAAPNQKNNVDETIWVFERIEE